MLLRCHLLMENKTQSICLKSVMRNYAHIISFQDIIAHTFLVIIWFYIFLNIPDVGTNDVNVHHLTIFCRQDFHHCNYGLPRDRIDWSERAGKPRGATEICYNLLFFFSK